MLKMYLTGAALGIILPQYLSLKDYAVLYDGLYKPHRDFRRLKAEAFKNDLGLNEDVYFAYWKNILTSLGRTLYYFPYGKYKEDLHERQKACYKLIENFEFVKETLDNFDYIEENLKAMERKQREVAEGSYEYFQLLEKEARLQNRTADDDNLEYLQMIADSSKDEMEKLQLEKAIVDKGDYMRSLSPEFKVERQQNRVKLLESYYQSIENFKNERRGQDSDDKFTLYRDRMNKLAMTKWHESEEKRIQKERNLQKEEKQKLNTDVFQDFKQATPKSVQKELEILKDIFGGK